MLGLSQGGRMGYPVTLPNDQMPLKSKQILWRCMASGILVSIGSCHGLYLPHWVTHICVGNLTIIGSEWWLVAWSAPSHYLNQCRIIRHWGTNCSEILIEIIHFDSRKSIWKRCPNVGPCIITATWRCHKTFSRWEQSFHWKGLVHILAL